jgi:LPXTG-motif cell wall-anchored protein
MDRLLGLTVLILGVAGFAMAGNTTPEIDANSAAAGVALLSGGLLVLRGRRTK